MMGNRTLDPTEPSICSAINLPPSLSLCSFTHPAIYPSSPVAKGPCLFVALIIWANFLCNLFPSQPPTWSSSIKLLKVEPLIPASPFPPIISCFFSSPSLSRLKFRRWQPFPPSFTVNSDTTQPPLFNILLCLYFLSSASIPIRLPPPPPFSLSPSAASSLSLSFSLPFLPPSCHGSSVFCCCLVWSDFAQTRLALGKVRSPESALRSPQVAGTMNTL